LFVLIVTTVGCDRLTKQIARTSLAGTAGQSFLADFVRLDYAENTGGFLSIGSELEPAVRTAIFTIGTAVLMLGLLIAVVRRHWHDWDIAAICLALAGGGSNLLDRIVHGTVVDFVSVGVGGLRTGIFNVADVAILVGLFMLISPVPKRDSGITI
jgi:signal peptidase II